VEKNSIISVSAVMVFVDQQLDVIALLVRNLIGSILNLIKEPQANIIADEKY
jgi:hypothetical protein